MVITCPNPDCKKRLKVDDALVGRRVSCPVCKTAFVIEKPAPMNAPTPASSSAAAGGSDAGTAGMPGTTQGGQGAAAVPGSIGQLIAKPVPQPSAAGSVKKVPAPGGPPPLPAGAGGKKTSGPPPLPKPLSPLKPVRTESVPGQLPVGGPAGVVIPPIPNMPPIPRGGGAGLSLEMLVAYARKLSPAPFGLVLLCFFLPFVHVSCSGERVTTFSGFQLVTGTEVSDADISKSMGRSMGMGTGLPPELRSSSERRKVGPELWAVAAFLTAIAGLAISFIKDRRGWIGGVIAGSVGAVMLLLLKLKIDNDVVREGRKLGREFGKGLLEVQYATGYHLALLVFIGAAALHGYFLLEAKKQRRRGLGGVLP